MWEWWITLLNILGKSTGWKKSVRLEFLPPPLSAPAILDKINGKPRLPLPPKSRMGKWRVFALRAPSSLIWGGMGVCCSILFCPRLWVSEACSQISSFASPPSFLLSCSPLVPNPPSTTCAFGLLHKRKREVFSWVFLTQEFGSLRKAKDRRMCIWISIL